MNLLDAPEKNIEFVMCSDIQNMEGISDFDDNELAQDPFAEMSRIELHPSSAVTLSVQIISNDSIQSIGIQKNGRLDVSIFCMHLLMNFF